MDTDVTDPNRRAVRLRDLIGQYWDLAYAEGKEGRDHDTEDGAAQRCWSAIDAEIQWFSSALAKSRAADQIVKQVEDRFPNWHSHRDLIDCIDCTLHALRRERR